MTALSIGYSYLSNTLLLGEGFLNICQILYNLARTVPKAIVYPMVTIHVCTCIIRKNEINEGMAIVQSLREQEKR